MTPIILPSTSKWEWHVYTPWFFVLHYILTIKRKWEWWWCVCVCVCVWSVCVCVFGVCGCVCVWICSVYMSMFWKSALCKSIPYFLCVSVCFCSSMFQTLENGWTTSIFWVCAFIHTVSDRLVIIISRCVKIYLVYQAASAQSLSLSLSFSLSHFLHEKIYSCSKQTPER